MCAMTIVCIIKQNSRPHFKMYTLPYMFFTESRKRTGGSESGRGVVRKKKALSVSADDLE